MRLQVLPMERFIGEVFRTCQIRKLSIDLKAQVIMQMEMDVKKGATPSEISFEEYEKRIPKQLAADKSIVHLECIDFGRFLLHGSSELSQRLRLACLWHQKVYNNI